jgi:hypothetical protein
MQALSLLLDAAAKRREQHHASYVPLWPRVSLTGSLEGRLNPWHRPFG